MPIHLYFHGSGETGNGVLKCGLPKLINEQSINPAGLVFCIQAKNGKQFYDSKYLTGVLELAKKVGSENGGDPNRISVSGHSMGAVAGYQIISDHPNDFTAFIPISGFAHATTSSALEYKKEGLVFGIGSNIFKLSGSVILYGVVSAYIFGIIRFLLEV